MPAPFLLGTIASAAGPLLGGLGGGAATGGGGGGSQSTNITIETTTTQQQQTMLGSLGLTPAVGAGILAAGLGLAAVLTTPSK